MLKPLAPTSIKFTKEQKSFLKRQAVTQRHGKLGRIVKSLVDEAMQRGAA